MEALSVPVVEWGVAALPIPGQTVSGDRHVVKPFPRGLLVAAVDGLGHGDEAAAAAEIAVRVLETHSHESVLSLVERCHESLRMTRGVVMSLGSFSARGTLTWVGVGNVEGRLTRASPGADRRSVSLLLQGGVVGGKLPNLSSAAVLVDPGDTLIFATDGVRGDFREDLTQREPPQRIADRILAEYGKRTDDALVVVARYTGSLP